MSLHTKEVQRPGLFAFVTMSSCSWHILLNECSINQRRNKPIIQTFKSSQLIQFSISLSVDTQTNVTEAFMELMSPILAKHQKAVVSECNWGMERTFFPLCNISFRNSNYNEYQRIPRWTLLWTSPSFPHPWPHHSRLRVPGSAVL